jgi:hypothetical protein
MMKNNGTNRSNSQGLNFDNFKSYESDEPMNLTEEEDIPHVLNVQEIDDKNGSHLLVKFDDGTMLTTHTHGRLKDDYYESLMPTIDLMKRALGYLKKNIWLNKKVDIGQMMETSLMLSHVSKLLHTTAQCISSDETERLQND